MKARVVVSLAMALFCLLSASATADFYDLFLDGQFSDPNYWDDPNDPNCGYYDVVFDIFRQDPNLYDPNVVPWDVDNPMWQMWSYLSEAAAAWVEPTGLNMWTSSVSIPYMFLGGVVNTPPYTWRLYPDMTQDPNDSPTFYSTDTSHYILAFVRWPDPNRGEAIVTLHGNPQGWTGMFLGINKSPSNSRSYMYMHCSPVGDLDWDGPGGSYTLDLEEGIWMMLQYDADGDTSVPNAPPGAPLWKSAVWNGDKYADAPTSWDDANYVMVTQADNGQPLVYKSFGSGYNPADPNDYQLLTEGICLVGVYGTDATEIPSWIEVTHVECRDNAEFVATAHNLDLTVTNAQHGTIEIDPMLPDPNDPNLPEDRLLKYTEGTNVVMTATPVEGKTFKGWTIYDPNYPGDINHSVTDTNAVLFLVMDSDWQIEAAFKCGSSLPPFVAMMLLTLGLGVVARRLR